jgi:hypothetical protein
MVSRLIRFIPKCSWSALVCQDFTMVGRQCSAPGAGEASNRPSGGTFRRRRRQAPRQNARFCHFSRSKGRILEQSKELTLTGKASSRGRDFGKRRPRLVQYQLCSPGLQSGEAGFQTRGNARYINPRGFSPGGCYPNPVSPYPVAAQACPIKDIFHEASSNI